MDQEVLLQDVYEKFKNIPKASEISELDVLENLISIESSNEIKDIYKRVYLKCVSNEISETETKLKNLRQKKYLIENSSWSKITIQGETYWQRADDRFAYRADDLMNPIYMWSGRSWTKLISNYSVLENAIE